MSRKAQNATLGAQPGEGEMQARHGLKARVGVEMKDTEEALQQKCQDRDTGDQSYQISRDVGGGVCAIRWR